MVLAEVVEKLPEPFGYGLARLEGGKVLVYHGDALFRYDLSDLVKDVMKTAGPGSMAYWHGFLQGLADQIAKKRESDDEDQG